VLLPGCLQGVIRNYILLYSLCVNCCNGFVTNGTAVLLYSLCVNGCNGFVTIGRELGTM
jgi:hypothetical protein